MTALVDLYFGRFYDKICAGGCDGCLNVDNPDNAGLADLIESLESLYQEQGYSDIISRSTQCYTKYLHIKYLQMYVAFFIYQLKTLIGNLHF